MSEEKEFVFQPEDDRGTPWGPPVTIKYTTDDELREALDAANAEVTRTLARAMLKTASEPETPAKKYDVESPMSQEQIEAEALAFFNSTPDYYGCAQNFAALSEYMAHFSLAPIAENWKLAFHALQKQGLLIQPTGVSAAQIRTGALTLKDVDSMPADVYKRRLLSEPDFAAHVEKLYGAA